MFSPADTIMRHYALQVDLRAIPEKRVENPGLFEKSAQYDGPLRGNSFGEFLVPYGEGSIMANEDVLSYGGGSLGEVGALCRCGCSPL